MIGKWKHHAKHQSNFYLKACRKWGYCTDLIANQLDYFYKLIDLLLCCSLLFLSMHETKLVYHKPRTSTNPFKVVQNVHHFCFFYNIPSDLLNLWSSKL